MSEDDFDLLLETLRLWKKKIVRAEFPKNAVWKNANHDKPVTIVARMGQRDGETFYQTAEGTGVPASELTFS